jgi:hypothetical protein
MEYRGKWVAKQEIFEKKIKLSFYTCRSRKGKLIFCRQNVGF